MIDQVKTVPQEPSSRHLTDSIYRLDKLVVTYGATLSKVQRISEKLTGQALVTRDTNLPLIEPDSLVEEVALVVNKLSDIQSRLVEGIEDIETALGIGILIPSDD